MSPLITEKGLKNSVYHTDPECIHVRQATSATEIEDVDGMRECRFCRGPKRTFRRADHILLDLDPEDLGLSPLGGASE